jgi:LSD1 subclass zinc finger protein
MSPTRCPSCRRALALPEHLGGALVKCPACAATFRAGPAGPPPRSVSPAEGSQRGPDAVTPRPSTPGEGRILPSRAEVGTVPSAPGRDPPRGVSSGTGCLVEGIVLILVLVLGPHLAAVSTLGFTVRGWVNALLRLLGL